MFPSSLQDLNPPEVHRLNNLSAIENLAEYSLKTAQQIFLSFF